ncbi:MAG: hypothetical protein V9G17_13720 [Nitrospira sp.]
MIITICYEWQCKLKRPTGIQRGEPTFTQFRTCLYLGKLKDIENEFVGVYDDIPHETPKNFGLFLR